MKVKSLTELNVFAVEYSAAKIILTQEDFEILAPRVSGVRDENLPLRSFKLGKAIVVCSGTELRGTLDLTGPKPVVTYDGE